MSTRGDAVYHAPRMGTPLIVVATLVVAALPAQAPPTSPLATETLLVRGRCVDDATGAPLARCRVRLTGHQSTGYSIAWSRTDWADPPEATTAADGTFRFEVRLPAADEELDRGRYHLRITHPTHAPFFSHCAFVVALARGGADYGDVRLPAGVRPRIRCEDTNGVAQPGVLVYVRPTAAALAALAVPPWDGEGPQSWIMRSAYRRTDVDGYLHLDDPLPAGEYLVEVREREAKGGPATVVLPRAEPIVAVVAPLDAPRTITGRIVDESGQAVGGAVLSDGDDGPNACTTRGDGAFTLVCVKPTGRADANLRLALNSRFDGWLGLGTAAWGQRDVELRLPAKALHTFVVRTAAGAPVEAFNVHCVRQGPGDPHVVRLAGTFAGGRATCHLPDGYYRVLVAPSSERMLASDWQIVAVDAAHEAIELVVEEATPRAVEVRFADGGGAAAGVLVEAITGAEPQPCAWVPPATVVERSGFAAPASSVVASARTDANGRAVLHLRAGSEPWLRVSGPGATARVFATTPRGGGVPSLVVERGATLVGTVGPAAALLALDPDHEPDAKPSIYAFHSWSAPTLAVVDANGRVLRDGVRIDPEGRFRVDGLPAGSAALQLQYWIREGAGRRRAPRPLPLGECTLRLEQPETVTLQVPTAAAGR